MGVAGALQARGGGGRTALKKRCPAQLLHPKPADVKNERPQPLQQHLRLLLLLASYVDCFG